MSARARVAALSAALLALFLGAGEARAQAAACVPTQAVSATADADGVYTTTLTCADTSAAEGAADYRELFYNHGALRGSTSADRDATIMNNNALNHLSLTIGSGVVFTADGFIDHRLVDTDAAILLTRAGAKTVVVEDGAIINLERTPTHWAATDPDRPSSATTEYDPAWYPTFNTVLDALTAIAAHSYTSEGGADVAIRHDGVINVDIKIGGTYGKPTSTNPYRTSGGRAIDVQINDDVSTSARSEIDVLVEMGATGVIRHVEGSDGLNGIYAHNDSEDGDIRIDLAEGSLIDVTEGGGYGVLALILRDANNSGARTGDLIVSAAGTIRTAVRNRVWGFQNGIGIFASSGSTGNGRVLVTSSGTIETSQAAALEARAWSSANTLHDDPDTPGIEGHLVDVAGGTVETRGTTAIYASTGGVNSDMTVRVAEGAVVRAQALTDEDYENGAIPQRAADPDGAEFYKHLSNNGNAYVVDTPYRYYGWRQIDLDGDGTNDALEPIITGIVVRTFSPDEPAEGVMDQVLVGGTVETIGGKTDVDPAIWMERGGRIAIGAAGRVSADSGLAILAGCLPASEYRAANCEAAADRDLDVAVAGRVEGDIRLRGGGDLTVMVMEGGAVTGTIHGPTTPMTVHGSVGRILLENGGSVTIPASGRLTGVDGEALRSAAGDLSVTVAGTVEGDIRNANGSLRLTTAAGSVIAGTVHNPVAPLMVPGSVGRILLATGGTVTIPASGRLTGVDGEALRSEAGGLSVVIAGMVTGAVRSATGDFTATISGRVDGSMEALGAGDHEVTVARGGVVTGEIHLASSAVAAHGSVGAVRFESGGTIAVGPTGRILSLEGAAARNARGDLAVTIYAASGERPDEAAARVQGRIEGAPDGETTVTIVAADGRALRVGESGSREVVPSGPYGLGVSPSSEGGVTLTRAFAPRARVYEALPSILLGVGGLPTRGERMAAPRSERGVWARVEAAQGAWKAEASTAGGVEYDVNRYGLRVGVDIPLGANAALGFSAHHRRGSADVKAGGEVEVAGNGLGVSAAYAFGQGFYLDGQVEATWHEADLESDMRGKLKTGTSGFGWAAGAEVGRRVKSEGLLFTTGARLTHSRVSMDEFTDALGSRVSIEDGGRSTVGLEVRVEKESGAGRLFGAAAFERDFSEETSVDVSGVKLESEGEASRLRLRAGGARSWGGGKYAVRGSVDYATSGDSREIGGGLSLTVRF